MSRMKRIPFVPALAAVIVMVLAGGATAGGGFNPPPPGLVLITSEITAHVVIDPHETFPVNVTSSAKNGYIVVQRKHLSSAETAFQVPLFGFALALGCDLTLTNTRFVSTSTPIVDYRPMNSWMNDDVMAALFQQIGITTSAALQPTITGVVAQACLPAGALDSGTGVPGPGILSMDVEIGFWAPPGTVIPKK